MPEPDGGFKRGDLFPPLKATLKKWEENTSTKVWEWKPIDLTEATSVTVFLRSTTVAGTFIKGTCTIPAPKTGGVVEYAWVEKDTDLADRYDVEWEILWSNGKTQTVPGTGYASFEIEADLDNPE